MDSQEHPQASGLTVIVPAFNERDAIRETLRQLKGVLAACSRRNEIIVVNDGSSDETAAIASAEGARVISHPVNSGYGGSIISGIEAAQYDTIAIVDADGTYPIEKLLDLLAMYDKGFHMVVAARQGRFYEGTLWKRLLRFIFRSLAEFTCGQTILDINSGLRIFDRRPVLVWRASLSTGFSFTTTITLLFMLNNLFVGYMPIIYNQRIGKSKVRLFRDSLRSLQIILTTIAQFNPLKLFLLLALMNIAGNLILCIFAPSTPYLISWNTLSLIAAAGIIALLLLKPIASSQARKDWSLNKFP